MYDICLVRPYMASFCALYDLFDEGGLLLVLCFLMNSSVFFINSFCVFYE